MPYEEISVMQHRLELDGRERLLVTGVEEVERFDEEEIVMNTTAGVLVVGGTQLHIGKLNLDGGELHVDGAIHTLLYEDKGPSGGQGASCGGCSAEYGAGQLHLGAAGHVRPRHFTGGEPGAGL